MITRLLVQHLVEKIVLAPEGGTLVRFSCFAYHRATRTSHNHIIPSAPCCCCLSHCLSY